MTNEFLKKLNARYKKEPLKRDQFGRRQATAREIEHAILGQLFKDMEGDFPPTDDDKKEKGDD